MQADGTGAAPAANAAVPAITAELAATPPATPAEAAPTPESAIAPPVDTPAETPVVAPKPVVDEDKTFNELLTNPILLGLIGGGAVVLLLLLLLLARRRKAQQEAENTCAWPALWLKSRSSLPSRICRKAVSKVWKHLPPASSSTPGTRTSACCGSGSGGDGRADCCAIGRAGRRAFR